MGYQFPVLCEYWNSSLMNKLGHQKLWSPLSTNFLQMILIYIYIYGPSKMLYHLYMPNKCATTLCTNTLPITYNLAIGYRRCVLYIYCYTTTIVSTYNWEWFNSRVTYLEIEGLEFKSHQYSTLVACIVFFFSFLFCKHE